MCSIHNELINCVLFQGRELTPQPGRHIEVGGGVTTLVLEAVTADEGGKYVVHVENKHGHDCYYASVAVEGIYSILDFNTNHYIFQCFVSYH